MELAAAGAGAGLGVEVVVARLFNLIGSAPGADSAPARFARQLAAMTAAGRPRPLGTGNLDAVRDYLDSRDAARALTLLGELPDPDPVYNMCSGRGVRLQWVARQLWRLGGAGAPFLAGATSGRPSSGGAGSHPPDRLVGDPRPDSGGHRLGARGVAHPVPGAAAGTTGDPGRRRGWRRRTRREAGAVLAPRSWALGVSRPCRAGPSAT